MLTTGGRGLWGNSPSASPLASPVGSPDIQEKGSGFSRFFKEMKSNRDKDKGERKNYINVGIAREIIFSS